MFETEQQGKQKLRLSGLKKKISSESSYLVKEFSQVYHWNTYLLLFLICQELCEIQNLLNTLTLALLLRNCTLAKSRQKKSKVL